MSAKFKNNIPGRWSSHPDALKRQRLWLLALGALPLVILFAIIFLGISDINKIISFFANITVWVKIIATAVCLSLGFLFTYVMMNLVSRTFARKGVARGRDDLPFSRGVALVALFFWAVPMLAQFVPVLKNEKTILFVLYLICFAPFLAIMCWVLFTKDAEKPEKARHRVFLLLSGSIVGALAIAALLGSVADWVEKYLGRAWPWAGELSGRLILFSTLLPVSIVLVSLWRILWLPPREKKIKEAEAENEPAPDGNAKKEAPLPEWVQKLCGDLPHGVRVGEGSPELKTIGEDFAEIGGIRAGEFSLLMGGKIPTEDQCAFLNRFDGAYLESLDAALENGSPKRFPSRADILLHGCEGGGKTEALCAAALYAALVRGQQVLFLVSSASKAKNIMERLGKRLEKLQLGCYASCEILDTGMIDDWKKEESQNPKPSVLVATPFTLETHVFSNETGIHTGIFAKLRDTVLRYEVVLVDDFMELDVTGRAHLVFIIDKLRLLLCAEHVLPQFVVAAPRLHKPEGIEFFGIRLFGLANFNERDNAILLRPRFVPPFWSLTLRVAATARLESVCASLARKCLGLDLKVLMYRKGVGQNDREALEKDIRGAQKKGRLQVISHADDIKDGAEADDAVFYLSMICGDSDVALRLAGGDERSVYIRVAAEGEAAAKTPDIIALVPDESAIPLRIEHLKSLLAFITPGAPLDAAAWGKFGVTLEHPLVRELELPGDVESCPAWRHDDWEKDDPRYVPDEIWPCVTLEKSAANIRGKIKMRVLPFAGENIFRQKDSTRLVLAECGGDAAAGPPRQFAVWRDNQNEVLGESDLAHASRLRLATDYAAYAPGPVSLPLERDGARHAMSIKAQLYRGDGNDLEICVRSFKWTVPKPEEYRDRKNVWEQGGVAGFEFDTVDNKCFRVEAALGALLAVSGGEPRKIEEFDFAYPSYLSGLILLPTLPKNGKSAAIRDCLDGTWDTTDPKAALGFSTALTHAVTAALRSKLDGWSFFTVAPVFHINRRKGSVGSAVIWLLEPENSGKATYSVLRKLLESQHDFTVSLIDEIAKTITACDTLEKLRLASGLAFIGEELADDDRDRALEVIRGLREHKRVRLDDFEKDVELKEFDKFVVAKLWAFEPEIDVSEFAAKRKWNLETICDRFDDVLWNHPEIFYISRCSHTTYWTTDPAGVLKSVVFKNIEYGITPSELPQRQKEMDGVADKFRQIIKDIPAAVGRAKAAHEFVVRKCKYDHEVVRTKDRSPLGRSSYSVLVRGEAVCEGYTMGYIYLCELIAKVRCEEVLGNAGGPHAWNYVQLEGKWYHVDTTWDASHSPKVMYDHFLLSDDAIRAKDHQNWSTRGLPAAKVNYHNDPTRWEEA